MAHLIDKDALVAEIERRIDDLYDFLPDASKVENGTITISDACNTGKYTALESFRNYIDTIEVKDVNSNDAFIEKACEFLDGVIYDYIELKYANVDTFMDVDNKRFIEDFRKYMKGE